MPDKPNTRRPITLEVPEAWLMNPGDGAQHRMFYAGLLSALAEMNVTIDPVWLPRGAERAPRRGTNDNFVISFHSHGSDGYLMRCKESYIPMYFTMDAMGYSCFSELSRHPERFLPAIARIDTTRAKDFVDGIAQDLRTNNLSKYPQPDSVAQDRTGYVFVPLQLEWDSVAKGTWIDPLAALERTIHAARNTGRHTIVKRHPLCRSPKIAATLDRLAADPDVTVSTASVNSLIAGADLVVGANSGVLFEALLQGRDVVSFAASDFGLATHQVRSLAHLEKAIAAPAPPDMAWRYRFLSWYLRDYCVQADNVAAIRRKIQAFVTRPRQADAAVLQRRYVGQGNLYFYSVFDRIKRRIFS
ncbi:hypothetical protein LGQ03_15475 [Loktanella sp. TSTF-M6]|uniref:Capsular polysaccharide export protein n=1 Tax=Loktanella gaetbuli TaxID=2881335 RepID=A0ABS8BYI0_9RHOB|nr:hypothetical protein [Loktanella gaetbuli]MCB5200639.1 hypothetical protein [Loktanella gaetbuli]